MEAMILPFLIVSDTPDGIPRAQMANPARRFVELAYSTITSFFCFVMEIDSGFIKRGNSLEQTGTSPKIRTVGEPKAPPSSTAASRIVRFATVEPAESSAG